jgi:hypothetical protein
MVRSQLEIVSMAVSFTLALTFSGTLRAETVISNLMPSSGSGIGIGALNPPSTTNTMQGEGFRTGSDPLGYRLNSVTLHLGGATGNPGDFVLELYEGYLFGTNGPIGEFVVTSNPTVAGLYYFDFADDDLILAPATRYMIVASAPDATGRTVSQYGWRQANFPTVTSGPGWLIIGPTFSNNGGANWTSVRSEPFQFAIDATAIPEPTSILLAGLACAVMCHHFRKRRAAVGVSSAA